MQQAAEHVAGKSFTALDGQTEISEWSVETR
jgi:hypothetical protein